MKTIKRLLVLVLMLNLFIPPFASAGHQNQWEKTFSTFKFPGVRIIGKQMVLNAKGKSTAYVCETPPTSSGATTALCFDVPLFDMRTGAYVGMLTDRLADVTPVEGGGLTAVATSTFKFTEWRRQPSFTTRVLGNVQPFIEGSESMTHITGFVPAVGENNIISGTGIFKNASGSAREAGTINLATFQGQPGDEVDIDFIWVIRFD